MLILEFRNIESEREGNISRWSIPNGPHPVLRKIRARETLAVDRFDLALRGHLENVRGFTYQNSGAISNEGFSGEDKLKQASH